MLRTSVTDRRPSVRLVFDSAEMGTDLPRPFGAGLDDDLAAQLDAAFAEPINPVRDTLRRMGYTAEAVREALAWLDRHHDVEGCEAIDFEDWPAVNDALDAPDDARDWPSWTDRATFAPTPEERGWAAETSPLDAPAFVRELGLIPSAYAANIARNY